MSVLVTERLRLEPFDPAHLDGLQALNGDELVMRHLSGRPETRDETAAAIENVQERWAKWGFSWWSFFEKSSGELVGAGCIQHLGRDPSNPLEIGWRLRSDKWGQGLATEAAIGMARFAFETLGTDILCAVCHPDNSASSRVMLRLGMRYRGMERWNEKDVKAFEVTRTEWQAGSFGARPKGSGKG